MIIIGNFKLNCSMSFLYDYFDVINKSNIPTSTIIAVPNAYINTAALLNKNTSVQISGQGGSLLEHGAFTGQISFAMQRDCGATYALIGHSEDRAVNNLNIDDVIKSTMLALKNNLQPVVCFGNRNDADIESVYDEIKLLMQEAVKNQYAGDKIIIAYEPIWSIGTGVVPSPEVLHSTLRCIRKYSVSALVIYGGSVSMANVSSIRTCGFDGVIIGGASLDVNNVVTIANNA